MIVYSKSKFEGVKWTVSKCKKSPTWATRGVWFRGWI